TGTRATAYTGTRSRGTTSTCARLDGASAKSVRGAGTDSTSERRDAMNKFIGIGNVGRKPEGREAGGKRVCNFSIAINEGRDKVTWLNVVAWNKTAELCLQYLDKGSKVAIDGRIQTREFEKDGQRRSFFEIVADRVEFLSPKGKQE